MKSRNLNDQIAAQVKQDMGGDSSTIPTIDLRPFLEATGDDNEESRRRKSMMRMMREACCQHGFFLVENHGVPTTLMARILELSREFFESPDEEKLKWRPQSEAPLPAGYNKQPSQSPDKNEYLLMLPPSSPHNVYPNYPPQFKEVLEEIFSHFTKLGLKMESMLNECMGLPPGWLKQYNEDRSWDVMVALRYFPASAEEDTGISQHEDGNCFTFVLQDDVGGLQVLDNNSTWIPVAPSPSKLVVNVGDVIQVLSNDAFKSATHRVVRLQKRSRYSVVFFYNLNGETWVEPLPQFTKDVGQAPKYRGFFYKEYQQLRLRNKTHPPKSQQDVIHITHYRI